MIAVVPDMKLSANVGSDRSWVWNAAADVSEGEPEPQTLAIRFANSESTSCTAFPRLEAFLGGGITHQCRHLSRCQPFQRSIHQGSTRKRGALHQGRRGVDKAWVGASWIDKRSQSSEVMTSSWNGESKFHTVETVNHQDSAC